MTAPTVDVVESLPDAFAELVVERFSTRRGPRFSLVLSGGPTAERCYGALARTAGERIDWSLVDIYLGDERYVPADDADANQRLVRETLVEPVGGVGSFAAVPTDLPWEEAAAAYAGILAAALATSGDFDLVHLGMGPDGHTASLFPGGSALEAPANGPLMVPSEDPNGRNPHPRLSLTLGGIARGRLAVFTVAGDEKREALHQVLVGVDLPAARVRAAEVRWLVDAGLSDAVPDRLAAS